MPSRVGGTGLLLPAAIRGGRPMALTSGQLAKKSGVGAEALRFYAGWLRVAPEPGRVGVRTGFRFPAPLRAGSLCPLV